MPPTPPRRTNGRAAIIESDTVSGAAAALRSPLYGDVYPSVTAFAENLRRYLHREPVVARPNTLVYRSARFFERRARAVAATAALGLLVASLTAVYAVRLASERDRARLEVEKSAKMSALLTSLLTGADPYASRDREPTVRNILDAGAERVQKELGDQPDVKAEMLTVIGRVYQRLGLHDKAAPLLQEALSIERRPGAGETARLAQTLNDLGVLSRERRDLYAATALLEESLAMRRRLVGNEHKDVAVTLVELGRAFVASGLPGRDEDDTFAALRHRGSCPGDLQRRRGLPASLRCAQPPVNPIRVLR
jgi:tetratricopeptide (TPR) repeat protein